MTAWFPAGKHRKRDERRLISFSSVCKAPALRFPADVDEFLVFAGDGGKRLVRALLHDLPVVNDENLIRLLDRCQPVCDGDDGFAAHQRRERLLDQMFVFGVDAGGGFVQDDDRRVLEDGTGNGDALPLTAGERAAALADNRVVAVRQRHDKVMAAGFLRRCDHLRLGGIRFAEQDVCANGVVEEIYVLKHHGDVCK